MRSLSLSFKQTNGLFISVLCVAAYLLVQCFNFRKKLFQNLISFFLLLDLDADGSLNCEDVGDHCWSKEDFQAAREVSPIPTFGWDPFLMLLVNCVLRAWACCLPPLGAQPLRALKKRVVFYLNKSFCGVSHSGDGEKRGPCSEPHFCLAFFFFFFLSSLFFFLTWCGSISLSKPRGAAPPSLYIRAEKSILLHWKPDRPSREAGQVGLSFRVYRGWESERVPASQ